MFLNPNEEAPWTYYRWIIRRTLPIVIMKEEKNENSIQITLNEKI